MLRHISPLLPIHQAHQTITFQFVQSPVEWLLTDTLFHLHIITSFVLFRICLSIELQLSKLLRLRINADIFIAELLKSPFEFRDRLHLHDFAAQSLALLQRASGLLRKILHALGHLFVKLTVLHNVYKSTLAQLVIQLLLFILKIRVFAKKRLISDHQVIILLQSCRLFNFLVNLNSQFCHLLSQAPKKLSCLCQHLVAYLGWLFDLGSRLLQTLERVHEISVQDAADASCGLHVGKTTLKEADIADESRVVETH